MPNPESQPYDYDEVTRLRLLLNQAEIQRDAFKAALNTEVLKVMRVSVIQATIDADNEIDRLKAEVTDLKSTADRLKAEVERLTALVESNLNSSKVAMGKADAVLHERDSLKAEVERLRKAGDEVIGDYKQTGVIFPSSLYAWNAAKEGKQS